MGGVPFLSRKLLEGVMTDADSKSFAEELSGILIGVEKLSSELVGLLSSSQLLCIGTLLSCYNLYQVQSCIFQVASRLPALVNRQHGWLPPSNNNT